MRPPNRRELLATFLGLPSLLTSCNARRQPLPPAGRIVGSAHAVGHRLLHGPPPRPAADRWERQKVVIVGGGIAGLTAAWRLLRAGFRDFVLLELETAPGGTSRSGSSELVGFPWGAHYLPVPMRENEPLVDLLDEMQLVEGCDDDGDPVIAEQFLCRAPQERLFYQGRWYADLYPEVGATEEDWRQLTSFFQEIDRWVDWRDGQGRRAFAIPLSSGSDDAHVTELDRISMAEWLDRRKLTSTRLRWLVEYACRDDYGLSLEQTSAWAGVFYFAARKRTAGSDSRPYITWPEGNGRFVQHLYGASLSHVRLGWAVLDITPVEQAAALEILALDTASGRMRGIRADHVIYAAPHFTTRFVIRPYREMAPAHVSAFDYGPWMVANLRLKDRPRGAGFPLAWDNVFYNSPSLGYVAATHQRGIDYGPTVLTYYYPLCDENVREARSRLLTLDWEAWAEITLSDISRAHPNIHQLVERLDVMRWGHAMVRPRVGFIWGDARRQARAPFRGIHFAHSDLSGLPLFEEAFAHGIRAAEEVLGADG